MKFQWCETHVDNGPLYYIKTNTDQQTIRYCTSHKFLPSQSCFFSCETETIHSSTLLKQVLHQSPTHMKNCFWKVFLAQVICGSEPHPVRFRAKKYKVQEKSFSLIEFRNMMSHLPEHVSDAEIDEMFRFADKNNDGKISWDEFLVNNNKQYKQI